MNKAIKVLLINVAVVFGLTLLLFLASGGSYYKANDFLTGLGLLCLAAAVLDILVAVILFITGPAQYNVAKGFLLSAGVLFLAGFAACSSTTLNFH
jgi:hypothetical protein